MTSRAYPPISSLLDRWLLAEERLVAKLGVEDDPQTLSALRADLVLARSKLREVGCSPGPLLVDLGPLWRLPSSLRVGVALDVAKHLSLSGWVRPLEVVALSQEVVLLWSDRSVRRLHLPPRGAGLDASEADEYDTFRQGGLSTDDALAALRLTSL